MHVGRDTCEGFVEQRRRGERGDANTGHVQIHERRLGVMLPEDNTPRSPNNAMAGEACRSALLRVGAPAQYSRHKHDE